ncbi:hypothetical protein [Micromonospora tulbaghiae]|uniref:hypothetical protein n=1 Tax=Micromonospora tulbaghiae TaxID=479978 RepID=UPI003EB6E930
MTLVICSILFTILALTSQILILRRTFEVVVDLRASIGARRTEKNTPAGATSDTPAPAPRLVAGTLRRKSGGPNA